MPDDSDDADIIKKDDLHPLLGQLAAQDAQEPVFTLYPPAIQPTAGIGDPVVRGSFVGKVFCDTCGFTGGHAPDCPASFPPPDEEEPESSPPARRQSRDEAVIPIARHLVGAILRKIARFVEGE